jgi:RNA polymerase sigma-70 factor (ECF subfamily)
VEKTVGCAVVFDLPSVLNSRSLPMSPLIDPANEEFGRYRAWLRLLLRMQPRIPKEIDPSDVVQDTLLKAQERRDQYRGTCVNQYEAWLRRILATTLADACRRLGRQPENIVDVLLSSLEHSSMRLFAFVDRAGESPDQVVERREQLLRLEEALEQLPADQREAVELRHLHGHSVPEIAASTGRTIASSAGLLRRGMARLRELMDSTA